MKLFKYIHYDIQSKIIAEGEAQKEPLVWKYDDIAPDSDYEDITTPDLLLEYEARLVATKKQDAKESHETTMARLRIKRLADGYTHVDYNEKVYKHLSLATTFLLAGDWMNCYEEIKSKVTNEIFDDELKLFYLINIAEYLVNSGNYPEHNGKTIDYTTGLFS